MTFIQQVKGAGAVAAALTAIVAGYVQFGGPMPAWSEDIRRLDRQQVEIAVEVYQRAIRESVVTLTKDEIQANVVARTIVEQDIERDRVKLDAARARLIELGK
jgi:hypothetical protein